MIPGKRDLISARARRPVKPIGRHQDAMIARPMFLFVLLTGTAIAYPAGDEYTGKVISCDR